MPAHGALDALAAGQVTEIKADDGSYHPRPGEVQTALCLEAAVSYALPR